MLTESVVVVRPSRLMTAVDTKDPETTLEVERAVGIADVANKPTEGADDDSSSGSAVTPAV